MRNACIFASFLNYAFTEILKFRNYDLAGFRESERWHTFANMVSQCFAVFRKISQAQFIFSHSFANFRKVSQIDFRKASRVRKSCFFARFRIAVCRWWHSLSNSEVQASAGIGVEKSDTGESPSAV